MERLNILERETRISYINTYVLNECEASGINLELLILLEKLYNQEKHDQSFIKEYIKSIKNSINFQTLERKGLAVYTKDIDFWNISMKGSQLYNRILLASTGIDTSTIQSNTKNLLEDQFNEWWEEFPATSKWSFNGRDFSGSRGLRVIKHKCRESYLTILNENKYTHEEMVGALKYEIKMKKEDSLKTGINKLEYMKSTSPYLNSKAYINFVELYKINPNYILEKKNSNNGVIDL